MNYDTWKTTEPDCDESREDEGPDEPEAFVLAPKGTQSGGCLRRYLSTSLTREAVVKVFGKPDADAYWEPERGYDGDEWVFLLGQGDQDVRFTVYSRWGFFRVGANVDSEDDVDDFIMWLGEKLGIDLRAS